MTLKKFYGNTIKEARESAFSTLGKGCVVLESEDAANSRKASVTVMLDTRKEKLPAPAKDTRAGLPGTYSRKDLIAGPLRKIKETVTEGISQFTPEVNQKTAPDDLLDRQQPSAPVNEKPTLTMSRRSTPVYGQPQPAEQAPGEPSPQFSSSLKEASVSREVKALHRRFDHVEKLMSDALISANLEYVSHPAFQQLLNTGIQATTVSRWFEQVLNKGVDPYEQSQSFMFELGDIVRSALMFALPEPPKKNMLFVGPAGSGKTTLIMKLASSPDFMLEKNIALVSVEPKNAFKRYSLLTLFAEDSGLPCYSVSDGVKMSALLPELEQFDHVLFDSPSISLHQQAAFRDFWQIRQILSSVAPLEVHYAVNATLSRYYFKESYAANHPLQPDYVAITHLDQTSKWGHLIPFLSSKGCSVRYVSQGPHVPDNLNTFKPEWFAKQILSHQ